MKKFLLLLVTTVFLSITASAMAFQTIPFYFDLEGADIAAGTNEFGNGDGEAITDLFIQMSYDALTTSQISGMGVGATVTDAGLAYITFLTPLPGGTIPTDNEGFGSAWGLNMVWTDLTGTVTSNDGTVIKADYTSGTFEFWLDYDPYDLVLGDASTYSDDLLVMTMELTKGNYTLDTSGVSGSSYTLFAEIDWLLDDFLFDANGNDLKDSTYYANEWLLAYSAGDNDPASVDIEFNADGSLTVDSDHNSSIDIGVVPEPATMALFGIGLLCAAGAARRKNS
jgi:hypothetical protein